MLGVSKCLTRAAKHSCGCRCFQPRKPRSIGPTSVQVLVGRARRHVVLLRDDSVLVARSLSRVLLRSNHGELSARPCACLSAVVWRPQGSLVRQSPQCRAGAPRRSGSFQPAVVGVGGPLSLHPTSLPDTERKSEGPRGAGDSVRTGFLLGGPQFHYPCRLQPPGAGVARCSRTPAPLAR